MLHDFICLTQSLNRVFFIFFGQMLHSICTQNLEILLSSGKNRLERPLKLEFLLGNWVIRFQSSGHKLVLLKK